MRYVINFILFILFIAPVSLVHTVAPFDTDPIKGAPKPVIKLEGHRYEAKVSDYGDNVIKGIVLELSTPKEFQGKEIKEVIFKGPILQRFLTRTAQIRGEKGRTLKMTRADIDAVLPYIHSVYFTDISRGANTSALGKNNLHSGIKIVSILLTTGEVIQ